VGIDGIEHNGKDYYSIDGWPLFGHAIRFTADEVRSVLKYAPHSGPSYWNFHLAAMDRWRVWRSGVTEFSG
jgi:hypothetical protein